MLGALLIAVYVLAADLANIDLGRADNGDFTRLVGHWVAQPVGFAANWPPPETPEWQRRFFHCFLPVWARQPEPADRPAMAADAGSANLVWAAAFSLEHGLRRDGLLHVRVLGGLLRGLRLVALLVLYAVLARLLAGRSAWWPLAVSAPCVLALADPRTTTYFNSYYREGATLLYAPLSLAALLAFAVVPRRWSIAMFTAAATLVAASATAHLPIAWLGAAALPAAFWLHGPDEPDRTTGGWLALVLGVSTLLASAIVLSTAAPPDLRSNVAFHALFFGALTVSDDPGRDVAELGLPPEARELVGKTAFEPASQPFRSAHGTLVDHRLVTELLWHRPSIAWRLFSRAADDVWGGDLAFVWVADRDCVSRPPRLAWWTALKRACAPNGATLLVLLSVAATAGTWRARRRGAAGVAGITLAFAALAALAEIATTVVGNGLVDLGRHLVIATFFTDATVGLAILQLAFLPRTRPCRDRDDAGDFPGNHARRARDPRLAPPGLDAYTSSERTTWAFRY